LWLVIPTLYNMKNKIGWKRRLAIKTALKRKEDFQEFSGLRLRKLPSDCLAIYKLFYQCRPQVIVETGSAHGASALMLAAYADMIGLEKIISIDVGETELPKHPKIEFINGSSADQKIVDSVYDIVAGRPCSIILDSDHRAPHVKNELEMYHELVGKSQSIIVEDTHVDVLDFKIFRSEGGPLLALAPFLEQHPEFVEAEGIEPYVTTNFFGYLIHK
jgi:cephalosporin hydroxylase